MSWARKIWTNCSNFAMISSITNVQKLVRHYWWDSQRLITMRLLSITCLVQAMMKRREISSSCKNQGQESIWTPRITKAAQHCILRFSQVRNSQAKDSDRTLVQWVLCWWRVPLRRLKTRKECQLLIWLNKARHCKSFSVLRAKSRSIWPWRR